MAYIFWHSILTFYLFWHSIWHIFWHFLWHSFDILSGIVLTFFLAPFLAFYLAFYLTFYSGILSSIYSDILSDMSTAGPQPPAPDLSDLFLFFQLIFVKHSGCRRHTLFIMCFICVYGMLYVKFWWSMNVMISKVWRRRRLVPWMGELCIPNAGSKDSSVCFFSTNEEQQLVNRLINIHIATYGRSKFWGRPGLSQA